MELWIWVAAVIILVFGLVVARGAPYVPSHRRYVRQAFKELYPVSEKDTLVDLGSGDGVVLRAAAERGAKAVGYELNPILVLITKLFAGSDKNIVVKTADYWLVGLPASTTIVYVFAVSRDIKKLEKKLQQWTDELGHEMTVMTYGAKLHHKHPVKELNAHTLYLFTPGSLQSDEA